VRSSIAPFAGASQIRFDGSDLSRLATAPRSGHCNRRAPSGSEDPSAADAEATFKLRRRGKKARVREVQDHLRALERLFRCRLDSAAEGPGAELVDLSVVESTVAKAVEDLERASRELAVAESRA
jgi:hypothetical protein